MNEWTKLPVVAANHKMIPSIYPTNRILWSVRESNPPRNLAKVSRQPWDMTPQIPLPEIPEEWISRFPVCNPADLTP